MSRRALAGAVLLLALAACKPAPNGRHRQIYRCPTCSRTAPWTDGLSEAAGDDRDEFWCQTCGTQTALEIMERLP